MSFNQDNGKNYRPLIITISILLAAAAVFTYVYFIMHKKAKPENNDESSSYSVSGSDTSSKTTQKANDGSAAELPENPQEVSTTAPSDRNDGSVLPEGSESELISGAAATNRWEASSVISTVKAERIKVELDVYEKGKKTGETKTRYMYAAVVETRPTRINMINSYQYTQSLISGIPTIIDSYQSAEDENILFACSNEYCSLDGDNPNRYIYYNDENNLESTVIKNGILAQQGKPGNSLTINKNGKWEYPVKVSLTTSEDLIKNDVFNSVSYTYPVIWNGKKYDNSNCKISYDIWSDLKIAPAGDVSSDRTLIGKIDDNKYVFLISEGFSGGYLIDYMMNDLGAKYAYWGAAGYATGMYVKDYGVITSNNFVAHGDLFCVK